MTTGGKGGQARSVVGDVMSRVHRAWGESPFYQAQLKGPAPDRLLFQPADAGAADASIGDMILRGRIAIGAEAIDCEGELERLWSLAAEGGRLDAFLQEFSWLRHCAALGERATQPVRAIVASWLDAHEKWSPAAWEPYPVGERLTNMCCYSPMLVRGADALWRSRVLSAMARQTRHLAKTGHRAPTGFERLMTALSLTLASACLPGCDSELERGLELMRRELRLQIRPDGGHTSRNPSQQLRIVLRLQMVLKALEARRVAIPGFLRHIASRAAANVQFFRVPDGRLAVFCGGYEDDPKGVVAALQSIDPEATPLGFARHTGFQKLNASRALVIADVGAAQSPAGFVSASSFHFSSGRARIVANCGNGGHLSGDWSRALRLGAAHSVLSCETAAGEALLAAASTVHRRAEDNRGHLLEIERVVRRGEQQGPQFVRRLFLSGAGDNLRGEDALIGLAGPQRAGWKLRFHLHPSVKTSIARDGRSVILALSNKEGWRFRCGAAPLALEKSVYCGDGGSPVATEQIVLSLQDLEPAGSGDMVARWAFQRLDGVGGRDGASGAR